MNVSTSTLTFHVVVPIKEDLFYYTAKGDLRGRKLVLKYERCREDEKLRKMVEKKISKASKSNNGWSWVSSNHRSSQQLQDQLALIDSALIRCKVPFFRTPYALEGDLIKGIKGGCANLLPNMKLEASSFKVMDGKKIFVKKIGYDDRSRYDNGRWLKDWKEKPWKELIKVKTE